MSKDETPSLLDRLDACKRKVAENDTLQDFDVEITEVLARIVSVKAASAEEAEQLVHEAYRREEYILDTDDHISTDFTALEKKTVRDRAHGDEAI